MKVLLRFFVVVVFFSSLLLAQSASALPVFPGAEGFGTNTPAGSGRHKSIPNSRIYRVKNLKESGNGSLAACINGSGPRTCIFEVSGVIRLNNHIEIGKPYLTIAGQTAPYPGIMLRGAGLRIKTHDVLIQHIRIRPGDDSNGSPASNRDCLQFYGGAELVRNVVIDHVSLSWAVDEVVSTDGAPIKDVTISNTIISEALLYSIHPRGASGYGMLLNGNIENITLTRNLFINNSSRNPKLQPPVTGELVNNLFYNWGPNVSHTSNFGDNARTNGVQKLHFISNYYKPGPESGNTETIFAQEPLNRNSRIHVKGNIGPARTSSSQRDWKIVRFLPESPYGSSSTVFVPEVQNVMSSIDVLRNVPKTVGAWPVQRDSVDERLIEELLEGKGRHVDCVQSSRCSKHARGWPQYSENRRELTLPLDPFGDADSDGYTNLEEWLHGYSARVESLSDETAPFPPSNFKVQPLVN